MESRDIMESKVNYHGHVRKVLLILGLFCLCGGLLSAVTVENGNMAFSIVINKPKDPFCSVTIRDEEGVDVLSVANIRAGATLTDIFATVFVDTNISDTYQIRFICTPFQMPLPGGSFAYLYYDFMIYDDDTPVAGAPFNVGPDGYTSAYMLAKDKTGKHEESLQFAKLAVRLNNVQSALAGDSYQADITVEVRTV